MKKTEAYIDERYDGCEIVLNPFLDVNGVPGLAASIYFETQLIDIFIDNEDEGLDEVEIVTLDRRTNTLSRYKAKKESSKTVSDSVADSMFGTIETVIEHYQDL